MQRATGGRQQAADAREIDRVVGVPAIGGAAPRRDQAGVPQLAQVVRDQVLRLADQVGQLVHRAVAAGQIAQQPPAQRDARPAAGTPARRGLRQPRVLSWARYYINFIRYINLNRSILKPALRPTPGMAPGPSGERRVSSTELDEISAKTPTGTRRAPGPPAATSPVVGSSSGQRHSKWPRSGVLGSNVNIVPGPTSQSKGPRIRMEPSAPGSNLFAVIPTPIGRVGWSLSRILASAGSAARSLARCRPRAAHR